MMNESSISKIQDSALAEISKTNNTAELENLRVVYLGKKGSFTALMKELGSLDADQKKIFGAKINIVKEKIIDAFEKRLIILKTQESEKRYASEKIDISLPVRSYITPAENGSPHPITATSKELEKIFSSMGFTIADGPEVETDYYDFQALNMPLTHPARDMQDTLYTNSGNVMRTQTSAVQARFLEKMKPPFRIVCAGRCFRCERIDAFHSHTFYQMEGMLVDKNVTVGHLLYFMKTLLKEIYGTEQKIRLRPGFFPFVEPGFELDIWYSDRWVELLPCGLVHPELFNCAGLNPNEWQGFAFGLGLSRLAMTRYQVPLLRYLDDSDLRFIKQFPRTLPK